MRWEGRTAMARAWVRLPSGKRLDLLNPTPFDWDDRDLALGLARTYRWGGHSAWPLPLSVAQHVTKSVPFGYSAGTFRTVTYDLGFVRISNVQICEIAAVLGCCRLCRPNGESWGL